MTDHFTFFAMTTKYMKKNNIACDCKDVRNNYSVYGNIKGFSCSGGSLFAIRVL